MSGTIRHRRRDPANDFTHRLVLAYLDLDELPSFSVAGCCAARPGSLRFRRRDYLGSALGPLRRCA